MSLSTASASGSGSGGPSKVPIPRLIQPRGEPSRKAAVSRLNRVTRACLTCRARKIKCNGAKPTCANCRDNTTECVYASSRKDRLKTATGQNQELIDLLRDLRGQVSGQGRNRIDDLLASVVDDVADAAASLHKSSGKHDDTEGELEEDQRETNLCAEGDSPADLDFADKASDADNINVISNTQVSESHHELELFELPTFEDAERLLHSYMDNCHNSFPLLSEDAFTRQFYDYYAALDRGDPYHPPRKWQAQLNLVFAIGAVYDHLTLANGRGHEPEHLMYHSRAWALSLKDPWWLSTLDFSQMQVTGLLSFYYLCTGHINRSWTLSGMAVRTGYALGLHICNEDSTCSVAKKEVLARIWWAHYELERLMAVMTGRPSSSISKNCSVPLPLPLSSKDIEETIIESRLGSQAATSVSPFHTKTPASSSGSFGTSNRATPNSSVSTSEQANSGSYLKNIIQLSKITQHALGFYVPGTGNQTWQGVQETIMQLTAELEIWTASLSDGLNFFKYGVFPRHRYKRERNTLDIFYHSTIILITRPCLCRLDRRIYDQRVTLSEFSQRSALTCVKSAKAIAGLLPDHPEFNLAMLYEVGPWWIMVHVIMQSFVILLLEISYELIQLPHDRREITLLLKKLVRWLRAMKVNNEMARRAYSLVMGLLRKLSETKEMKMDVADLFYEDEQANVYPSHHHGAGGKSRSDDCADSSAHAGPSAYVSANLPHSPYPYDSMLSLDVHFSPTDPMLFSEPRQHADSSAHAYLDFFTSSSSTFGLPYPGLFFTSFDEQNPLPRFEAEDHEMDQT